MIWIIIFFIIILISSVLAYRSMRDYEEFPEDLSLNSLFFVGNPAGLTEATLQKMHSLLEAGKHFFALEKLMKGKEKAIVLYGPKEVIQNFPELSLVELEDYLTGGGNLGFDQNESKTVNVNQVLSWLVEPKNNLKKLLHVDKGLVNLVLDDSQKVFIQVVLMPLEKGGQKVFQSTLRVMVADNDPIKRVELAKKVNQSFQEATGLIKREDAFPESKRFESFKQRSLIPKEVAEFYLTDQEILSLVS